MARKSEGPPERYLRAFGRRLRDARIRAGYKSYAALADRLGIGPEAVRSYEAGEKNAKIDTLARISIELDVSLDYLILGKRP